MNKNRILCFKLLKLAVQTSSFACGLAAIALTIMYEYETICLITGVFLILYSFVIGFLIKSFIKEFKK